MCISKVYRPSFHTGHKVEYDGYKFDSKEEALFYSTFIKNCGFKYEVHPKFELTPTFEVLGFRLNAVRYTPDFVVYNEDGSIKHVFDVKPSFNKYIITADYVLRCKWFGKRYQLPIQTVVCNLKSFKTKVVGTTRRLDPVVKYNVDYNVNELY